jgi:hypothetical protein
MGSCEQRHQLGGFILHDEPAALQPRSAERLPLLDDEPVGCEAGTARDDILRSEAGNEFLTADAECVCAKRQRRRSVVELQPGLGPVEAVAIVPTLHEPCGMRQRDREVLEDRRPIVRIGRARRQRERRALP